MLVLKNKTKTINERNICSKNRQKKKQNKKTKKIRETKMEKVFN